MFGDLFWDIVTSNIVLSIISLVLGAAAVVGYFPLLKWFPVLGQYVPVARLVTILMAALLFFLVGFRMSDSREAEKNLRRELAIRNDDLNKAEKAKADEKQRADQIENEAKERSDNDAKLIADLKSSAACRFDTFDKLQLHR